MEPPKGKPRSEPVVWYQYIEIFNNNVSQDKKIFGTFRRSTGRLQDGCAEEAAEPIFVATKSHADRAIGLEVRSPSLCQKLLPLGLGSMGMNVSLKDVVEGYIMIKQKALGQAMDAEIHLLINDFLCSPRLYDGIDIRQLLSGPGGLELERDIHARRIELGLDNLDFLFVLGQALEDRNGEYLNIFKQVFDQLVEAGDVDGLHRVCEPLVVTGKIEWRHSDELLRHILRTGNLEVFRYVLDLASRMQTDSHSVPDHTDCTFHPLYTAIRLGHLETVEKLIRSGEKFDGFCTVETTDSQNSRLHFSPLRAAAYWGQVAILRMLLGLGMSTPYSIQMALNMAQSRGHQSIVQLLQSPNFLVQKSVPCTNDAGFPAAHPIPIPGKPDGSSGILQTVQTSWGCGPGVASLVDSAMPEALSINGPCMVEYTGRSSASNSARTTPNVQDQVGQQFGHRLSSALNSMCHQVYSQCLQLGRLSLAESFKSFGNVWERGTTKIRQITRNKPPRRLRCVLECLLVAAAVARAKEGTKNRAYQSFVSDLDCWKSVLPEQDRTAFDCIAQAVWGPPADCLLEWHQEDPSTVQRFHVTANRLVAQGACPELPSQSTNESHPDADHVQAANMCPGYLASGWNQVRQDSFNSQNSSWTEFAHSLTAGYVDTNPAFMSSRVKRANSSATAVGGVLPAVARLLGSVAFSVMFSVLIVIQQGSETAETRALGRSSYSLNLACAILNRYVDLFTSGNASAGANSALARGRALSAPSHLLPATIITPPATADLTIPGTPNLSTTPSSLFPSECGTPSPVAFSVDLCGTTTSGGSLQPSPIELSPFASPLSGYMPSPLLEPVSPGSIRPHSGQSQTKSPTALSPSLALSQCPAVSASFSTSCVPPSTNSTLSPTFPSALPSSGPFSQTASLFAPPTSSNLITISGNAVAAAGHAVAEGLHGSASPSSRPRSDPCPSCGRTFSSVTNLRKHLRDKVCVPGSKSRFACRNPGCERMLSTRWYRQQHEEQYCQFRRQMGAITAARDGVAGAAATAVA